MELSWTCCSISSWEGTKVIGTLGRRIQTVWRGLSLAFSMGARYLARHLKGFLPGRRSPAAWRANRLPFTLTVLFLIGLLVFIGCLEHLCRPGRQAAAVCPPGAVTRKYDLVAIELKMVVNKAGENQPDGLMYALRDQADAILSQVQANPLAPVDDVEPLVIRANVGDCIQVTFQNRLQVPASIHIQGVRQDVVRSDGAVVGVNQPSVASVKYQWYAEREGIFMFSDLADPLSGEGSSNSRGLWGALIVEPPGATWTDPVTGGPLLSGCNADIHVPGAPDFREFVLFMHDEMQVRTKDGGVPIDPMSGMEQGTGMFLNYRTEPSRIRHDNHHVPGEKGMMSSWAHGDPATPVLHAYVGDPARIRLVHAGVKETHVFHLHVYQWRLDPDDPNSTLIDSISIGPQETFTIEPLYGAGSLQQSPGDAIFHCHLYPHFDEGMWGLFRTYDVLEDGTRLYPDGTPIVRLQPLPDRASPPVPTAARPGYPLYIPGMFGHQAPRPPLGIVGGREPTALEKLNFAPNAVPGAPFVNPAPPDAPVRKYDIVGIQLPIVYNDQGWHDPQGRMFVLAEDEEAVLSGKKAPEPLVIRANAGDVIDLTFTNKFPVTIGGNAFQGLITTDEAGLHVHLVKFDAVASDGGANGWNYDSSAGPGETMRYRWYADTELRTVFFHDHLYANVHQQHGVFAALVVEPAGSTYHDPFTGDPIKSGTHAVIRHPNLPDFREFVLFVHDFALLFDRDGNPLNPPPVPNSHDDPGVMGVNYRCEPMQFRKGDPAFVFSSWIHGDPVTPLLEAYAGDPVRIRLLDGAHEEQHIFNLHGHSWRREPTDPHSPLVSSQTIGISEAFNLEFRAHEGGDQDFLYYFGGIDDLWLGLWGIMRVHGEKVPHLPPLADRPQPAERALPFPTPTGRQPYRALHPGDPAPAEAPVRKYDIVAIQREILYNRYGDRDPDGLMFVLAEDEAAVLSGRKAPEPLVIRANVGDLIEIRLTNKLPVEIPEVLFPEVPVQAPWPASNRVSLHPQRIAYDGHGSGGVTVGFNPDQTAGPGESIYYRWYADVEGTSILSSWGDVRNHRLHGLFGVLVVEPYGATYHDPATGRQITSGAQAVIRAPGREAFREFVVVAQNGVSLVDRNGVRVNDPDDADDYEDQGQKAFNYRSERLENRLASYNRPYLLFSSRRHGDPATPVFRAYPGDPVTIRYALPADKPRNTGFAVHGHYWLSQPGDPFSRIISVQGAISVGSTFDIHLIGGAGGPAKIPGDYLYRSGATTWDIDSGMWGILRVHDRPQRDLRPLP